MSTGTPVVPVSQNENGYDIDPVILGALAQEYAMNQTGLVYNKIFGPINTNGKCEIIGWDFCQSYDATGAETNMSPAHALVPAGDVPATCYSEAPEVDTPKWGRKRYDVKEYREKVLLNECCLAMCGVSDADYESMIQDSKVKTLLNRFLIRREIAGFDLITGGGVGAWNAGWTDGTFADLEDCFRDDITSDGMAYDMAGQDLCDPAGVDLLKIMENVQATAKKAGRRNFAVVNRHFVLALRRNDSLKGSGCMIAPRAGLEDIKNLLGVAEIYVADAMYNTAGFGQPLSLGNIWNSGFIFLGTKTGLANLEDTAGVANFGADLRMFDDYFRTYTIEEKGRDGVDYLQYNYSFTPQILNINAGTLFYNVGA